MDLDNSMPLFLDVIQQFFENRSFSSYQLDNLLSENPITYKEYRNILDENRRKEIESMFQNNYSIRKENKNILEIFAKSLNKKEVK